MLSIWSYLVVPHFCVGLLFNVIVIDFQSKLTSAAGSAEVSSAATSVASSVGGSSAVSVLSTVAASSTGASSAGVSTAASSVVATSVSVIGSEAGSSLTDSSTGADGSAGASSDAGSATSSVTGSLSAASPESADASLKFQYESCEHKLFLLMSYTYVSKRMTFESLQLKKSDPMFCFLIGSKTRTLIERH